MTSDDKMTSYDKENIFAKILAGKIPSVKIFENDICMAIMDAFPQSKGHALIIPKAPSCDLLDAVSTDLSRVIPHVQKLAIAIKKAMDADGIRIAQFNGEEAGQTVFHLHFHIIPAYKGIKMGAHSESMADMDDLKLQADLIRAQL